MYNVRQNKSYQTSKIKYFIKQETRKTYYTSQIQTHLTYMVTGIQHKLYDLQLTTQTTQLRTQSLKIKHIFNKSKKVYRIELYNKMLYPV